MLHLDRMRLYCWLMRSLGIPVPCPAACASGKSLAKTVLPVSGLAFPMQKYVQTEGATPCLCAATPTRCKPGNLRC